MKGDNTIHLISKVKRLSDHFIVQMLADKGFEGIVPSHGDIIVQLLKNESLSMSDLADRIGKEPSTVTTLVKKLVKMGYVNMYKDEADRRINRVALTDKGKDLEDVFWEVSEKMYETQYKHIPEEDRPKLRSMLATIVENFESME